MEKKNILITGITGLLGSAIQKTLQTDFNILDFNIDITDKEKLHEYDAKNIDYIIHTAAMTDVNFCEKNQQQCQSVNVEGTKNVVELAKKTGAKLLYISTASVFSGNEGDYKETDAPDPKNYYSLTKLLGEKEVLGYHLGKVLRINLIGIHINGNRKQNFFEWLVDSIQQNKDMKLFSDAVVNPLSNWTIAEFIKKIIEKTPNEKIIHIGSKDRLSKADIGKLVIEKLGNYKGNLEIISLDNVKDGAKRPKEMWLNTDLAENILGWKMPTLKEEINNIFEHGNHKN